MASASNPWELFGFDLRRVGALWSQGWAEIARWPAMRRIVVPLPVTIRHADGTLRRWVGDEADVATDAADGAFFGVEVPADAVLFRRMQLPSLTRSEIADAVRLEVSAAAPFPEDRCVWGWRSDPAADGRVVVTLAITSRDQIERLLVTAGEGGGSERPELWAFESGQPVILDGFGESSRRLVERRALLRGLGLVALALCLMVVLVTVPVWQARGQVFDARDQSGALMVETRSVVEARDRLVDRGNRLASVRAWLDEGVALMPLVDRLTELLPDSAHLTGLEVRDGVVIASGLADNAASLMEVLGEQPDFNDFRPSGISRDRVTGLETFRIEFRFTPESDS
jgi:general secretion pathway protein L